MHRQTLYFTAPNTAELREEPLPPPGHGEALVETVLSAVSPGTEMLVYRGQTPGNMAVDETITAMGGTFGFPIKFGYAAVGKVVEIGSGTPEAWLHRIVFAFNPHESHFIAPISALQPLPDDITPEQAIFLPNMETAVSFLMDGRPVIGERVVVIGQGVVGLLTTVLLHEIPLSSLIAVDPLPLRRDWAGRFGATTAIDPDQAAALLGQDALRDGADLTYELSGNPRALDLAIAMTGKYGRIVIGSWYGKKPVAVDLGGRFHRAHMRLIGSQVSALSPEWLGRWTKERRLEVAWEMIRRHQPQHLITHRLPIDRAPEAYHLLDEDPGTAVQIIFSYV